VVEERYLVVNEKKKNSRICIIRGFMWQFFFPKTPKPCSTLGLFPVSGSTLQI
jgi:hypothetical protein